jgi:hypothetical protein
MNRRRNFFKIAPNIVLVFQIQKKKIKILKNERMPE